MGMLNNSDVNFMNKRIYVEKAYEPSDLIWENLGFTESQKNMKRMETFVLSIVLLIIGFVSYLLIVLGAIFLIKYIKDKNEKEALKS